MGKPTRHAGNSEQHRVHLDREAHGLVNKTRVEVDIRVELAAHEVIVGESGFFKLEGDVEKFVLAGDLEHVVGNLLDDLGSRVVVLVHAVAETLKHHFAFANVFYVSVDVVERTNGVEHAKHCFVGAAMARAVQGSGSSSRG
ncbi:unannotated protein [freshwater metagenome]|uniref:Unannotated protein n=1 Tax=freshwater metagenome TaxID=449393 RepID=A0A6J6S0P2_9ZZZZ